MKYILQTDENGHTFPVYNSSEEVDTLTDDILKRALNALNADCSIVHTLNEIIISTE